MYLRNGTRRFFGLFLLERSFLSVAYPQQWGTMSTDSGNNKSAATYVTGVDKPGDVSKRSQFTIHIAANFTVFPAVVYVHESHHVPLQPQNSSIHTLKQEIWCQEILSVYHTQTRNSTYRSLHLLELAHFSIQSPGGKISPTEIFGFPRLVPTQIG